MVLDRWWNWIVYSRLEWWVLPTIVIDLSRHINCFVGCKLSCFLGTHVLLYFFQRISAYVILFTETMFQMKMFCRGSGFVFLVNKEDHLWRGIIMLKYFKEIKKIGYNISYTGRKSRSIWKGILKVSILFDQSWFPRLEKFSGCYFLCIYGATKLLSLTGSESYSLLPLMVKLKSSLKK